MRGAWIEIPSVTASTKLPSVSLPVRGAWIEMLIWTCSSLLPRSLPVRGAWIEMSSLAYFFAPHVGRSPCGERGLKCPAAPRHGLRSRRSPCGERGLKCRWSRRFPCWSKSLPVRGAWIEIRPLTWAPRPSGRSPCGERGLKFRVPVPAASTPRVAPRAGSVD